MLEKFKPAQLIAIDQDPSRLVRVTENLNRLALDQSHTEILAADATKWTPVQPVDCIVLDAPCSATGVIRRHPDIRLLRQSSDIAQTIELQKQILEHMWQQLKVGGTLLYITCSILKSENEQQMTNFFTEHTDAKEVKIETDWELNKLMADNCCQKHNLVMDFIIVKFKDCIKSRRYACFLLDQNIKAYADLLLLLKLHLTLQDALLNVRWIMLIHPIQIPSKLLTSRLPKYSLFYPPSDLSFYLTR